MTPSSHDLNLDAIQASLKTRLIGRSQDWPNELWESIDSTNDRACRLYQSGAQHGVMVLARQQTAGRGRQGRTWISPAGSGLYLSYLLKARCDPRQVPLYTLGAGVAAVRAIARTAGVELGLKWVNDLVYAGKKAGGILAEIPSPPADRCDGTFIVVGLGINLRFQPDEIPQDLANRIDWLERISGQPIDGNLLVCNLANEMESVSDYLETGSTDKILQLWRQHSVTLGREVMAISGNNTYKGTAEDIADSGALILRTNDGKAVRLSAGEISIRGADGGYA